MNLKNIYVTLIIFFIFSFVTFVTLSFNIIQDTSDYDRKPLDVDNIKTGDLFLISYNSTMFNFMESILGFNFVHPSIAVWEKNELFMIEFAEYTNLYKGLIKVPFKEWIRYNKNGTILKNSLSIKNDSLEERKILEEKILDFYDKNKEKYSNFSNFNNLNFFRFFKRFGKYEGISNSSNLTCTELLAYAIFESDIAKKNKSLQYFQPSKFVGFEGFDLNEKYYCDENYIIQL